MGMVWGLRLNPGSSQVSSGAWGAQLPCTSVFPSVRWESWCVPQGLLRASAVQVHLRRGDEAPQTVPAPGVWVPMAGSEGGLAGTRRQLSGWLLTPAGRQEVTVLPFFLSSDRFCIFILNGLFCSRTEF